MKKSELVLGNVVKAYKGETEYTITNITEEVVTLNNEKEVKIATLLKNYKFVRSEELVDPSYILLQTMQTLSSLFPVV